MAAETDRARAPQVLNGPCAWLGRDMAVSTRWQRDLDAAAIGALDDALHAVERRGLPWTAITPDDFPLGRLGPLIADIRAELEDGSGMIKLRGLPVDRYDMTALRRLYAGLACHLGTLVHQNRSGELMRDIRDEGGDLGGRYGQIAPVAAGETPFLSSYARTLSNGPLRFHTDRTDVVALLCVRQAAAGGVSRLCSSVAVHNAMIERRPELAAELYGAIWRSRLGEESASADSVYRLPVFGVVDGKFTSHFSLTYIEAAARVSGVPPLTAAQRAAIDLLIELAGELSFEMTLAPGDIQFLNSHVTYHGRTPFSDDAEAGRQRLLMRLWLAMPNSRQLPAGHEVLWGTTAPGARRGGIAQAQA